MASRVALALLTLLALPRLFAGELWTRTGSCDRIETYAVGGAGGAAPQSVVFVWNTAKGTVRRLDATGLVPIPVDEVGFSGRLQGSSGKPEPLSEAERVRAEVRRRFEETVLPVVDFRDTSVRDVLRLLQTACNANVPDAAQVRFFLDSNPFESLKGQPSVQEDATEDETRTSLPTLTFRAEHITVMGVLEVLRAYAALVSDVQADGSVLVGIDYWHDDYFRRLYRLNRFARETLRRICFGDPMQPRTAREAQARLRQYLIELGATPGELDRAEFLPEAGVLDVGASPSCHTRVEFFLTAISEGTPEPGAFRMHAATGRDGAQTVLLLDIEEGHVWRYITGKEDAGDRALRGERFQLVPATAP